MDRCALCPGKNNCVPPNGPEYGGRGIYGLGEAPGREEDKHLIPFCGPAGRELNEHYLRLAGIPRLAIRVGNVVSCLPDTPGHKLDTSNPKHLELALCCAEKHLYPELRRLRPKIIIAMGSFACHALDPEIDLDLHHGTAVETPYGTAFVMYHPARGMHEPKKMLQIRTDWMLLKRYLSGKLAIPVDSYIGLEDYRCLSQPEEVDAVLDGRSSDPMGNDTESTKERRAFCHTFSVDPGTGYLIRAEDQTTLRAFQRHLRTWKGPLVFHHWLHDRSVDAEMGLVFPEKKIRDTMVRSFHLGNQPQGLKALCYRLLGMTMQDFDDLVSPYSAPRVVAYYRRAQDIEWPRPEKGLERNKAGPQSFRWKLRSPRGFNTKLKIFFTYLAKNPSKNVFSTWYDNWEDEQQMVQSVLGPWPGKCITHVPFEDVIRYACRDADGTLRLFPRMDKAMHRVRRHNQEDWMDGT